MGKMITCPYHLGSMPMSVQAAVKAISFAPGDVAILNDPYAGGTHLPRNITMVLPVFPPTHEVPAFYIANRAHHADVGGAFAGSMGPAKEIFQEGIRIPPIRIVRGGIVDREMLDLVLSNVRTPKEREGDLQSQIGACRVGERRILQLFAKYGRQRITALIEELLDYSERLIRAELRKMPVGEIRRAEDWLDDDGVTDVFLQNLWRTPIAARSSCRVFAWWTSPARRRRSPGNINARSERSRSLACFYILRCLLGDDGPKATAGILRPLTLITPSGRHRRPRCRPLPLLVAMSRLRPAHRRRITASTGQGYPGAHTRCERRHNEQSDHWRRGSAHRGAIHLL